MFQVVEDMALLLPKSFICPLLNQFTFLLLNQFTFLPRSQSITLLDQFLFLLTEEEEAEDIDLQVVATEEVPILAVVAVPTDQEDQEVHPFTFMFTLLPLYLIINRLRFLLTAVAVALEVMVDRR
jgi:hypothetical protein